MGTNNFMLSVKQWIKITNIIGISARGGVTAALMRKRQETDIAGKAERGLSDRTVTVR